MRENLKKGSRVEATVFFADMKDFTKMSEALDPEEVDTIISRIFGNFESIIRRYEGFVEKYIGDALVAVFGAKIIHEDDPIRAVSSSLDFLSSMTELNVDLRQRLAKKVDIQFRIGINSGLVTIGKRGEFDVVTGHALAVAARLQAASTPNGILIAESVKQKCENQFILSQPETFKVKGKTQGVVAYYVLGRNQGIFQYQTPFIGRKKELERLTKSYIKFTGNDILCYYLSGEPGVGKTRLVAQFLEDVKKYPNFGSEFLFARCSPYGNAPFSIIVKLLLFYFDMANIQKPDPQQLEAAIRAKKLHIPQDGMDHFMEIATQKGKNSSDEKMIFTTLFTFLVAICKRHADSLYSIIIFIDNISFLDRQSRDFIRYFINHSVIKPFFILADRDFDGNIGNMFPGLNKLQLPPLDDDEACEFISRYATIALEKDEIGYIVKESKGNPFFIEEFVRYINEEEHFIRLPSTIQNIILSQIEKLGPENREILQKAACIGSTFTHEELSYLHKKTGGDTTRINATLETLINQKIIVKDNTLYRFRQEIQREVVYSTILNQNKQILHRLIGFYFLKIKRNEPQKIMHHFIMAEEFKKALELLFQVEFLSYDYVKLINVILEQYQIRDINIHIRVLFVKYGILFNNGRMEEMPPLLDEMFRLAVASGSRQNLAQCYHLMSTYHSERFDYFNTEFFGRKAIEYYGTKAENSEELANVIRFTALAVFFKSNREEALLLTEKIPDNDFEKVYAKAHILFYSGYYDEGRMLLENAYLTLKDDPSTPELVHIVALKELIDFYYELGSHDRVNEYCTLFLEKTIPNYKYHSTIYSYYGISAYYLGRKDEAFEFFKKAEYTSQQLNNTYYRSRVKAFLAEAYWQSGELQKALEFAKEALIISQLNNDHSTTYENLLILTLISINKGDIESAAFYLGEAKFYNGMSKPLDFKYRIMYLFLNAKYNPSFTDAEKRSFLSEARKLLREKLEHISDPQLRKAFMNMRFHKNLVEECKKLNIP